jgi:xylan 1,4-beta-xylosidase
VIGCGDATGAGWIDPDLFIDRDGKAYLYVSIDSPQHRIAAIPMTPDLLHRAGATKPLFGVSQSWENGNTFATVEGPFLIRRGNLYYMFYSGDDYNSNYAMGYATAPSPLGPFTKYRGNPILRGTRHVKGPGGGSIVQGPDGHLWLVYHGWPGREGYENGGVRDMWIDPLVWHGSTVSVSMHPG